MAPLFAQPLSFRTAGRPVLVLSDLHLGDRAPNDGFGLKDELLIDELARAEGRFGALVLAGDIFDVAQGGSVARIARRRSAVIAAFRRVSARIPVVFIPGNHDYDDVPEIHALLPDFQVAPALALDQDTLVAHGHEMDVAFREGSRKLAMQLHCLVERAVGVPIRLPLQRHDSIPNRIVVRGFRLVTEALRRVASALGLRARRAALDRYCDYWLRQQVQVDPGYVVAELLAHRADLGPFRRVVLGHSHLPGQVSLAGLEYVNSGSWAGAQTTVTVYRQGQVEVRDLRTGEAHRDEAYRVQVPSVDWDRWWDLYYRGRLRYVFPENCQAHAS